MVDKDTIKQAADHCENEAEEAMRRALNFSVLGSGPESSLGDFEKAGALFAAAEHLRNRKA